MEQGRAPRRGARRGRAIGLALVLAGALTLAGLASADSGLPAVLQVNLMAKVAAYDRTLPGVREGTVRVLVVQRPDVAESAAGAARILHALSDVPTIAGLPHDDVALDFADAASLAQVCRTRNASLVYLAPGLASAAQGIATALAGVPALTVTAEPEAVDLGVVMGFDVVGGKPKLIVNLSAMRRQGVQLPSELLRIAKVIE